MAAESYGDPEEQAGRAAQAAYLKVAARKVGLMWLLLAVALAGSLADYAFGVAALWLLPRWAVATLAGYMAAEFVTSAGRSAAERRRIRGQRQLDAGLAREQEVLASLRRHQEQPLPAPWWQAGWRRFRFWQGLTVRAVYSAAALLVLAHGLGTRLGLFLAVCFTIVVLAVRDQAPGAYTRGLGAAAFLDPSAPRDTPEA
jgi:hypothetical protein